MRGTEVCITSAVNAGKRLQTFQHLKEYRCSNTCYPGEHPFRAVDRGGHALQTSPSTLCMPTIACVPVHFPCSTHLILFLTWGQA